jgi:two-component system chemotaxis response regulator CheB
MPLSVTSGKLGAGAFAPNLLLSKIRCCSIKRFSRMARAGNPEVLARSSVFKAQRAQAPEISRQFLKAKYDAALIGVSTGGPEALMRLVPALPKGLRAPIFIALHMPKDFTGPMAALLAKNARMSVEEFGDNKTAIAGNIYLARGGLHGIIACKTDDSVDMRIDDGPPENGCKPSVDALFRSGAARFKDRVAAVVLTGMGNDGVRGAEAIKKQGGLVIVQDEATSVVWGMPGSVARAGFADEILPLDSIAPRLGELLGAGI